ncbi:MAG: dTMP kinase [Chloroflexota bacterium]|nr:dTMP kinase [Chloroflexota bacterium]
MPTEEGRLIVFEGPEGGGKSLQAKRLAASLRDVGYAVVLTREPGGTPLGEEIRTLLLRRDGYTMVPVAEALLMTAARAQHVADVIRPALADGAIVVCDRFVDSTFAYQGHGRGLPLKPLEEMQRFATCGRTPDLRILLDLAVDVGLARRSAERESVNRIDAADLAFHERVREGFLALAAADPSGWIVVDAQQPVDAVAVQVRVAVLDALSRMPPRGTRCTKATTPPDRD